MMANKKTLLASSALEERHRCAAITALALFLVMLLAPKHRPFASLAVMDLVKSLFGSKLFLLDQRHLKDRASHLALRPAAPLLLDAGQLADMDRQPAFTRH
jgi:hypothetical protein